MHPIECELLRFTGTEAYHSFCPFAPHCVLTDGAEYLAEKAKCYWFMDIIASIVKKIAPHGFSVCQIKREGSGATFTADDGNGNVFFKREVAFVDAPFDFRVFAQYGGGRLVIMLPSEY